MTIARTALRLAFLVILIGLPFRYTLERPLVLPISLPPALGQNFAVPAVDLAIATLASAALPAMPLAIIFILPLVIGRALCSWICPIGLLHEVASPRRKEGRITIYRNAKYVLLLFAILMGSAIGVQKVTVPSDASELEALLGSSSSSPMTVLDPSSLIFDFLPRLVQMAVAKPIQQFTVETLLSVLQLPSMAWIRIAALVLIVIGASYVPWFWCKYACPSGAAQALASRFSVLHVRRELHKCVNCRRCQKACPMNIPILQEDWRAISNPECTLCLRCVEECRNRALKVSAL
jgi:polyferredoxin